MAWRVIEFPRFCLGSIQGRRTESSLVWPTYKSPESFSLVLFLCFTEQAKCTTFRTVHTFAKLSTTLLVHSGKYKYAIKRHFGYPDMNK